MTSNQEEKTPMSSEDMNAAKKLAIETMKRLRGGGKKGQKSKKIRKSELPGLIASLTGSLEKMNPDSEAAAKGRAFMAATKADKEKG